MIILLIILEQLITYWAKLQALLENQDRGSRIEESGIEDQLKRT